MKASIIGASGYAGGELLRLLLGHPFIEVAQATSESHLGEYIYQQHPNLRKRTTLKFTSREMLEPCDVLFLALPHGESQKHIDQYTALKFTPCAPPIFTTIMQTSQTDGPLKIKRVG